VEKLCQNGGHKEKKNTRQGPFDSRGAPHSTILFLIGDEKFHGCFTVGQ